MPRRIRNWSYRDVIDFLKENEFGFEKELQGSHEVWIRRGNNLLPSHFGMGEPGSRGTAFAVPAEAALWLAGTILDGAGPGAETFG